MADIKTHFIARRHRDKFLRLGLPWERWEVLARLDGILHARHPRTGRVGIWLDLGDNTVRRDDPDGSIWIADLMPESV